MIYFDAVIKSVETQKMGRKSNTEYQDLIRSVVGFFIFFFSSFFLKKYYIMTFGISIRKSAKNVLTILESGLFYDLNWSKGQERRKRRH